MRGRRLGSRRPAQSLLDGGLREIVEEALVLLYRANLLVAQEPGRRQDEVAACVPGLRVSTRIVDRHVEFHRVLVDATIAFDQMQLVRVRMAALLEPRLFAE